MKKRPTPEDMHIAAQWLEHCRGSSDEQACHRVAKWLVEQAVKAEFEKEVRRIAKESGRPTSEVRAGLKREQH